MQRKVNKKNWFACFITLVFCTTFFLPVNAQETLTEKKKEKKEKKNQKEFPFAIRDGSPMSSVTAENYEEVANKYKTERTQELRNRLVFMAVSQIDVHFRSYERSRRHRNNLFQTIINILEVGAATAISLTNGERAKSVIADGLGFIQGSRDGINKNYRLLERQILVNKMIEKRAKVLATIYERVAMTEEQYPFERAFVDILDYFEAGRMDSALNELSKDSGKTASNAEDALKEAKRKADIRLSLSADQIKFSNKSAKSVQAIIDSESRSRKKIAAADVKVNEQKKIVDDENAKPEEKRDAEVIAKATTAKNQAETDKKTAEGEQRSASEKLQKIFSSIEQDKELIPFLNQLPEVFPNLADKINASLERIRSDKGTPEDYASILLKFYRRVTDALVDEPQIVEKATKILEQ